jgi:hypothetical protein
VRGQSMQPHYAQLTHGWRLSIISHGRKQPSTETRQQHACAAGTPDRGQLLQQHAHDADVADTWSMQLQMSRWNRRWDTDQTSNAKHLAQLRALLSSHRNV